MGGPPYKVHVFETGRLTANGTFLRGEGFSSLLRRVDMIEFPVLAYVIEHAEGPIVIDTGLGGDPPAPRRLRGFPPRATHVGVELGAQMRERGLNPAEVRTVVLTHLDWDHTGGLGDFPPETVLVHGLEYAFAQTRLGRFRYLPSSWPMDFAPTLYDLDPEPYGPFAASRSLTETGDVRLVPVPGHAPGQVAVAYETGDVTFLFAADHMLRADWFVRDVSAGRFVMLGAFARKDAKETTRRLERLLSRRPTVLLPAHDADAPKRLAQLEVTSV